MSERFSLQTPLYHSIPRPPLATVTRTLRFCDAETDTHQSRDGMMNREGEHLIQYRMIVIDVLG